MGEGVATAGGRAAGAAGAADGGQVSVGVGVKFLFTFVVGQVEMVDVPARVQ
jgi:hypothetical protein